MSDLSCHSPQILTVTYTKSQLIFEVTNFLSLAIITSVFLVHNIVVQLSLNDAWIETHTEVIVVAILPHINDYSSATKTVVKAPNKQIQGTIN